MDKSYQFTFPADDFDGHKKKRRALPWLIAAVAALLAVAVGLGAYVVLSPPSLGNAALRTLQELGGGDGSFVETLTALAEKSEEQGAEVTLSGRLPVELTGLEPLELSLTGRTSPREDPTARYDLTLTAGSGASATLSFYNAEGMWLVTGICPEDVAPALFVGKKDIVASLEASAWNPAVGGEGTVPQEVYDVLLEIARALEETIGKGGEEGASYTEEERRELEAADRALGKRWKEIVAPTLTRRLSPTLTKTVHAELSYDKLAQMVTALREVCEEYPVLAELIRSTVTFTTYGEEMLAPDDVAVASIPASPTLTPLMVETEGEEDVLDDMLDAFDEWLADLRAQSDWSCVLTFAVSCGRLSALDVAWTYENDAGDRDEVTVSMTFPRPRQADGEAQTLAAVTVTEEHHWTADATREAGSRRARSALRYTLRQDEREREYLLTFLEEADEVGEDPAHTPDPLSTEAESAAAQDLVETGRLSLRYDRDASEYRFAVEARGAASEAWTTELTAEGVWRLSESGNRFEVGLREITVTTHVLPPEPDGGTEPDGGGTETRETRLTPELLLTWQVGDGTPVGLPAKSRDLFGLTAEEIRTLLDEGLSGVTAVLTAAFGDSSDILYTVDGVALRGVAEYQNYVQPYIALYQDYYYREGDRALHHLVLYDETLGLYLLLDFDKTNHYLSINFLAEMTDLYEVNYHAAALEKGQLVGHRYEIVEQVASTCKAKGWTSTVCTVCRETFHERHEAVEHTVRERTNRVTVDDGTVYTEAFRYCDTCGAGENAIWEVGGYLFNLTAPSDREEVSLGGGYGYMIPHATMMTLPDYIDAERSRLPLTTLTYLSFADSSFEPLELLRLGRNVRVIEENALSGATELQVLVVYPSLTEIGANAFLKCTSLRKVYFCGTEAQWKSIAIAKGNDPLTSAEIVFNHDGSPVAGEILSLSEADSALKILAADSRDGKQGAVLASHPDADRLTVLSTAAAEAVAYDDGTDTVIVCGGYDSAGGTTTVSFFHAFTGALTDTWTLPYRVNAMDAGNGLVAVGERERPTVHIYSLSDGVELVSYDVKTNDYSDNRDYIGDVFVDGSTIIACNTEQHCVIDFYNIAADDHRQSETLYQPALAMDKRTHTLAAITQDCSPTSIYFYDTQTGAQITWHWNVSTSAPISWNGFAFVTSRMVFSVTGEPSTSAVAVLEPSAMSDAVTREILSQSRDYVFWTVARKNDATGGLEVGTMARVGSTVLTSPIAFCADRVLELDGSRFLLWGEGYREVLIVNLS